MEEMEPPIDIDKLFYSNKDIQRKILTSLSVRDILYFCFSDYQKRLSICHNEDFWKYYANKHKIEKDPRKNWQNTVLDATRGNDDQYAVMDFPSWNLTYPPIPSNYKRLKLNEDKLNKIIFNYPIKIRITYNERDSKIIEVYPDNTNGITLGHLMDRIFRAFWDIPENQSLENFRPPEHLASAHMITTLERKTKNEWIFRIHYL